MNDVIMPTQDGNRQYECLMRMMRDVMDGQAAIKQQLDELTSTRDALVGSIQMDTMTLQIVLDVSDSTMYRWRQAPPPNCLPYYHRQNGSVYYLFDEVLKALRKGQLNARGFNRLKAIERMTAYRDDLLSGKGGGSWL